MLNLFDHIHVYLARDPVDMRKQIDGLAVMVQEVFELNPFDNALFAFHNRRRDKVKILHWHGNGFCLLYKRLEEACFQWPNMDATVVCYSTRELQWLLEGLSLDDLSNKKIVKYSAI